MPERLPIGVCLRAIRAEPAWWLDSAVRLDAAGYAGLWCWDHVMGRGDPTVPVVEAWTMLSMAAARTERATVAPFVLNVMNRHPAAGVRLTAQPLGSGHRWRSGTSTHTSGRPAAGHETSRARVPAPGWGRVNSRAEQKAWPPPPEVPLPCSSQTASPSCSTATAAPGPPGDEVRRDLVTVDANRIRGCDLQRDVADELLEVFVGAGVRFVRTDFDQHADLATRVDVGGDKAVVFHFDALAAADLNVFANLLDGGNAIGLFSGRCNAFFTQPINSRIQITVRFRQRLFAIHHARASRFAQFLDQFHRYNGHV